MELEKNSIFTDKKQSDAPLVTVVTSTYEKFSYIKVAIDSVLKQNYSRIEYIITDDGSHDFPKEYIEDYLKYNKGDNIVNIRIIHHGTNIGTVRNLNTAFRHAKGKYIISLSADDSFYDERVISRIVDRFEKTDANLICTARCLVTESDMTPIRYMPTRIMQRKIEKYNSNEKQLRGYFLGEIPEAASGSAASFRTSFWIDVGGFDEDFRLWEDGPFFARYIKNGGAILWAYDIVSINYRTGGISMGKMENPNLLKEKEIYFNKYGYSSLVLDASSKRDIDFLNKKSSVNRFLLIFQYPDIVLKRIYNRYLYKMSIIIDKLLVHGKV